MRFWCMIFVLFCLVVVVSLNGETQEVSSKKSKLPGWARNIKDGKWPWKSRGERIFTRGTGLNLQMSRGDTIVSSLKPNSRWLRAPYQWMFAVDHDRVLALFPGFTKMTSGRAKPRIINIREKYKNVKLENRKKKNNPIGLGSIDLRLRYIHRVVAGVLVAVLMAESKVELPYNPIRCNGKHYTEYLSLGKANQGSYLSLQYNKMGKSCPLAEPLYADMAEMIYKTGKFILRSESKEYHLTLPGYASLPEGKTAHALWPPYIKEMNLYNSLGTN